MTPLDDPAIRKTLLACLSEVQGLWVREEMPIWRSIADVLTISDTEIHAYEIKSDVDSLTRLPRQMESYRQTCDRVTLVVGGRHLDKAVALLEPWVAVWVAQTVDTEVSITEVRPGGVNPRVNWVPLFNLLWRREAQAICEKHGLARGVRGKSKPAIKKHLRLVHKFPLETLQKDVRDILRNRVWDGKRYT